MVPAWRGGGVAGGEGGRPVTTEAVSPLTKPVMVSVKLGSGWPKAREALLAVTVRTAGVTVMLAVAVCRGSRWCRWG